MGQQEEGLEDPPDDRDPAGARGKGEPPARGGLQGGRGGHGPAPVHRWREGRLSVSVRLSAMIRTRHFLLRWSFINLPLASTEGNGTPTDLDETERPFHPFEP